MTDTQQPQVGNYHRPDVEYYDNVQQILEEDDLIETDVIVTGWNRKLRIRALTFEQMMRINQKSLDDKGVINEQNYILNTLLEGVIRPKFTSTTVEKLIEKNGSTLQQLADEIWDLGRISKKVFDDYISALKKADEQKETAKK